MSGEVSAVIPTEVSELRVSAVIPTEVSEWRVEKKWRGE